MADISCRLVPGLTLADTTFEVNGGADGPSLWSSDYGALAHIIEQWRLKLGDPHAYKAGYSGGHLTSLLVPLTHGISNVAESPVALKHAVWDNLQGSGEGHYSAELSDQITIGTEAGWNVSATAGVSFTVGLEVGFGANKASASTQYSLSVEAGKSGSKSESEAVGSETATTYDLPPGKAAVAVLLLQRGTVSTYVNFGLVWTGALMWSYFPYKGPDGIIHAHPHVYTVGAAELMAAGLLPRHLAECTFETQFAFDDQIVTKGIASVSPDHVAAGIDEALRESRGQR